MPVALKLSGARVQHKSDIGALALGLDTPEAVADAHRRLAPLAGDAPLLLERMAAPGVELIVAARRDAVVPALVVGLGGIWTELLGDVAIVPLPADIWSCRESRSLPARLPRRSMADARSTLGARLHNGLEMTATVDPEAHRGKRAAASPEPSARSERKGPAGRTGRPGRSTRRRCSGSATTGTR